jgi:DNA-binding LacI/PurR family transcriptional regulator
MKPTVKLSDVAKAAGVSLGTASNVFSKPDQVSTDLRQLVENAARKLGYSGPDPKGRLLMGGKASAIGFVPAGDMSVATTLSSPFLQEFLGGVADECDARGASLLIISGSAERKIWAMRNALVDGFILGHASDVELLSVRLRKVPFVVLDLDAGPLVNSIRIKAYEGARLAAEHLVALGHRKFGVFAVMRSVAEPVWHPPGQAMRQLTAGYPLDAEKFAGYRDGLAAAGLDFDDMPLVEAYPAADQPQKGARMLLDMAPDVTAALALSDRNALALLEVARERGMDVPQDLSVIGFDDIKGAAAASPPLTSIAQPLTEKGRLAAHMVFENQSPRQVLLPVQLMKRNSTAAPRK